MSSTYNQYRHFFLTYGRIGCFGGDGTTSSTPARFVDQYNGYVDDGYVAVNLPFPFYLQGSAYYTAFVGSNGYITFGVPSSTYSGLSWSNPPYPKIYLGGGDRNYTYVGCTYLNGYNDTQGGMCVTIRIEGSYPYTINQGRGQANSTVEVTFINRENTNNRDLQGIGINYGQWNDGSGLGLYGVGASSYPLLYWSNSSYYVWAPYSDTSGYSWYSAMGYYRWYAWPYGDA
jgi:hypothetical protein